MMKERIFKKGWFWVMLLTVFTLILNTLLPYNSNFVEEYYSLGLFKGFRSFWDFTFGRSPIPLIYLLVGFLFWYLLKPLFSKRSRWEIIQRITKRLLLTICCLLLAFYWMWGFNYKRVDIRKTLGIGQVEVDKDEVFDAYQEVS